MDSGRDRQLVDWDWKVPHPKMSEGGLPLDHNPNVGVLDLELSVEGRSANL